uniref:Uncharacterized protein n=1 Tax=Anguilla anguilla TaxID=7936 RepID=A0A0E9VS67_ANGAN
MAMSTDAVSLPIKRGDCLYSHCSIFIRKLSPCYECLRTAKL